ncbi:MAG: DUF4438 domain-containing protein [Treponema sp.]|nr:DUF4438 domain-containing protein [Treponema sp.]
MRTNKDKILRFLVSGIISHPSWSPGRTNLSGLPLRVGGMSGIVLNVRVGDSAYGWEADHLEPGVSACNINEKETMAYYNYSCMGNKAKVLDGPAKGAIGYVAAKHAGPWHTMIDFDPKDMEKLRLKDPIQVESYGVGLKLLDYPDVNIISIDPGILEAMKIKEKGGKLHIPVAGVVPASIMGSGLGSSNPIGDIDYMTADWSFIKENKLEDIKLGDIVMIKDLATHFGAQYKKGAMTVGIIAHGDCMTSGHGPGVTFFMSVDKPILVPEIDKTANIKKYHDLAYGKLKPLKDTKEKK